MQYIKTVWKTLMRITLRIIVLNPGLYIVNDPKYFPKEKFYSQFGQDIFTLKHIFKNKKEGFFVDIGGNHPAHGNNTYLLELNGWKGLAVEPQETLWKLWPSMRKTPCLNIVIGPENKMVSFVEASSAENGLSGVEGFNKVVNDHTKKLIEQKRLDNTLAERSISKIDYLSIDVEGYEMNVLKSIDFSKIDVRLVGIENDLGFRWLPFIGKRLGSELGNSALRKYMKNKSYIYAGRVMCDDFFLKKI